MATNPCLGSLVSKLGCREGALEKGFLGHTDLVALWEMPCSGLVLFDAIKCEFEILIQTIII